MRLFIVAACLSVFSFSASATVIKTLDGFTYEWLELTATQGMSRDAVELELADSNSALYGYQYASRALVESLLLSYSSFDGVNGYHGDPDVVNGIESLFNDFGALASITGDGVNSTYVTVDGYTVNYDYFERSYGLFGLEPECGGVDQSCFTFTTLQYDALGNATMAQQYDHYGWDAAVAPSYYTYNLAFPNMGSYLVRSTTVPIPAAVWLFGSSLGLLGLMRRRRFLTSD